MAAIISSCSSSVRFASQKSNSNKTNNSKSESKIASKSVNIAFDKLNTQNDNSKIDLAELIVNEAYSWLGTPYRFGGDNREGVDCSGLVSQVYASVGIDLPRTSRTQFEAVDRISSDNLNSGDLIFFSNGAIVNHVGIYIGNGEMIHASSSRGVIKQAVADEYYSRRIAGIGRVFK